MRLRQLFPIVLLFIGSTVHASQLASRSALITALGGPGITENFANFTLASGAAAALPCATLNAATLCNGQGPGLVVTGINITFPGGIGQWDGVNYAGSTTQEILTDGGALIVTFTTPVSAFGVNLRALAGYPATATVTIFGSDDTTVIGTISGVSLSTSGVVTFVGWQATTGIGAVEFTQTGESWSPAIDDLEFGGTVTIVPSTPAPPTWLLLMAGLAGLGIYEWRRREWQRRSRAM